MSTERIRKLQEFLAQDPRDPFTRYALALEYASDGNTEQAVALFEELLSDAPSYVPAYQQLGLAYQKLGKRQEAIETLQNGLAVAASQGDAHARSEMQELLDEFLGT